MDLVDQIASRRFLGSEFLIWLWHRVDQNHNSFPVAEDYCELFFDDTLMLEAALAETEKSSLKGGSPAHSPEAHKALQHGKRVAKAKLKMTKGEREWTFVLDSGSFRLSGVKIPAVLSKQEDEPFFERMYLIEELEQALFAIYKVFLLERLGPEWEKRRQTIADWIAQPSSDEVF